MTAEDLIEKLYKSELFFYTDSDLEQFIEEQGFNGSIDEYIDYMLFNIIHKFYNKEEEQYVYAFFLE